MTREEEIKERVEVSNCVKYLKCGKHDRACESCELISDCADEDILYLLARNEELQRRVEKMERVVLNAREAIKRYPEQVCLGIKLAVRALDAADTA